MKFTTEIHWDNVFRHSCIQRQKIKRKRYPWCKDYGNLPAHILRLVTHRFVKRVWGKCFKFQKNAWWLMMNRGYHHNLKDKLQSEINETHRNRSPRSWNKTEQGRKRNVAFRPAFVTQYQPLVSTVKWKSGISYKTNLYFANFLKNHPLFPTRKENHGKEYAC